MLEVIIFNKDRLFQFKETIRTLEKYVRIPKYITVLTTQEDRLDKYITINKIDINKIVGQTDFNTDILNIIKNLSFPYTMFAVDDCIFFNGITFNMIENLNDSINAFNTRLHTDLKYCQPWNWKEQKVPSKRENIGDITIFDRTTGELDWNYPFEVSGSIYKTNFIKSFILNNSTVEYSNPNDFEGHLAQIALRVFSNTCICPKKASLVSLAINRVSPGSNCLVEASPYSLNELNNLDPSYIFNEEIYKTNPPVAGHTGKFVLSNPINI